MNGYLIILCCAVSLLLGGGGAYLLKSDIDKVRLEQALKAQQNADNASCNADKKITEDADAKIQQDNATLNARLDAAMRRVPARCVPVASGGARKPAAKGQPGQAQTDAGLDSDRLIEYAGECEHDRLQLNDLIDFVVAVWSRDNSRTSK